MTLEKEDIILGLLTFLILLLLANSVISTCKHGYSFVDAFSNKKEEEKEDTTIKVYNPLYTNKYKYTAPPGDVDYLKKSGTAIGTNGEFLPLQGKGAGFFLSKADENNMVTVDLIGGDPNIVGFNDFGMTEDGITNSYLIEGDKRIGTPGMDSALYDVLGQKKVGSLPCPKGQPHYVKQDGDCVLPSDLKNLNKVFQWKSLPTWKKI